MSPGRIGAVLAQKAVQLGAELVRDDVQEMNRQDQSWKIVGKLATYRSDKVVLSMGAWSPTLLKPLGIKVPLMVERGYHVQYPAAGIEVHNSVMDVDTKVVASAMSAGVRVAGQAEFAPIDAPPDPKRKTILSHVAKGIFPDLNQSTETFWMGRRPSFPDSLPVLGSVPDQEGLFVNFGHSHYGLLMAPKSAEIVAAAVTNAPVNEDLSNMALQRFL